MKKVLSLVLSLCLLFSTIAGVTIFAEDVVADGVTVCSDSSKMIVKVEAYDHFTDYYSIDDEEFVEDPTPVADGEFVVARVFMKGIAAYNTLNISLAFDPAKVQPCTTKASNGDVQYIPTDAKWNNGSSPAKTMMGVASGYEAYVSEYHAPGSIDASETEYVIFGVFGIQGETTVQTSEDDMTEVCAFKFKRMEGASLEGAISFFEPATDAGKSVYTNAWLGLNHGCWMNDLTDNQMADPNNHIVPDAFVLDAPTAPQVPTVSTVTVAVDDTALFVGDTANVTVTANYTDGSAVDVTADATVTVSEQLAYEAGVITAIAAGDATVTATYENVTSDAVAVLVEEVPVTVESVALAIDDTKLTVGDTANVTVTANFSDGTSADVTADATVVVSNELTYADGVITAAVAGNATVNASFEGVEAEAVTVVVSDPIPAALTSIALAVDTASLNVNGTTNITVTGSYDDGTTKDVTANAEITFGTAGVATYAAGVITAIAAGSTTVKATVDGFTSNEVTLTVKARPSFNLVPGEVYEENGKKYVDVAVNVASNAGIAAWRFELAYDKAVFTPVTEYSNASEDSPYYAWEEDGEIPFYHVPVAQEGLWTGWAIRVNDRSADNSSSGLDATQFLSYDGTLKNNRKNGTWFTITFEIAPSAEGDYTIDFVYEDFSNAAGAIVNENYDFNGCTITVEGVEQVVLEGIEVAVDAESLYVGDTANVTVTASYSDGTTADVTADATIVVSDELTYANGVVTAAKEGQATITATYEGATAEAVVTVQEVPVTLEGVEVEVDADALYVGETANVTVTAFYSDDTTADVTADATIVVSDELAYENGVITAAKAGQATITATYEGVIAEAFVVVENVPVTLTGIEVAVDADALYVGETANVTVTATYSDGTTADVTADAAVAVSEGLNYANGVITALVAGQATVTVTYEGVTAEATVAVENVPVTLTGIEVAVDDDALYVGETANVTVTASYSDGTTADITGRANVVVSDELTYANGVITAAKAGQATITATYEGATAAASVVVEEVPVTLEGIEVVVDADALTVGETANVTVTATYSDGTTADITADATVVVSDELTYANGVITAAKAGQATITVTYEGATAEASVEVEEIVVSVKVKGNVYMEEVEINLNDVTLLAKFLAKWESAIEIFENEDVKYNANVYRADQEDANADFGSNDANVTLYINSKDITKLLQFVNEIGVDDADKVWNVDLNAAN